MIVGHERVKKFLQRILENQSPIHGFLFFGPSEVGKLMTAVEFAKGFLCEKLGLGGCGKCLSCQEFKKLSRSRDLFLLSREEGIAYGIDEVRRVTNFLLSRPQLSSRKVVIIDEADELTPEAQNALLKTLEEPLGDSALILVTAKPSRLYPTVRSRLTAIPFRRLRQKEIIEFLLENNVPETKAKEIASLSFGRPGRALALWENPDECVQEEKLIATLASLLEKDIVDQFTFAQNMDRDVSKVFSLWQIVLRDQLLALLGLENFSWLDSRHLAAKSLDARRLVKTLQQCLAASLRAEDTNANKRLLMENLFLATK